ncbi:RHS repeat-associated core domain-containing protein [Aquimarina algiphila]|uniref:RHS repeat-associated core domain-containing protein n=1 Tax=Aquimarina algiphila TaxID=2047982 RepID=UPI001430DE83|nr:RHS repeat-associated core domain-containing protein [Aquimarina algiphila]
MFFCVTDYTGNYVYKNGNLEFFNHQEGIVEKEADGYKYVYQFKDHLDNIRLSYKDANKDGAITQDEIIEENNYYPFGLQHKGYNNTIVGTENNYQTYQGKEDEKELGKNTYAFGWRDYDPAVGRFNKIDRFAEKYYAVTPYHFSANNPAPASVSLVASKIG